MLARSFSCAVLRPPLPSAHKNPVPHHQRKAQCSLAQNVANGKDVEANSSLAIHRGSSLTVCHKASRNEQRAKKMGKNSTV